MKFSVFFFFFVVLFGWCLLSHILCVFTFTLNWIYSKVLEFFIAIKCSFRNANESFSVHCDGLRWCQQSTHYLLVYILQSHKKYNDPMPIYNCLTGQICTVTTENEEKQKWTHINFAKRKLYGHICELFHIQYVRIHLKLWFTFYEPFHTVTHLMYSKLFAKWLTKIVQIYRRKKSICANALDVALCHEDEMRTIYQHKYRHAQVKLLCLCQPCTMHAQKRKETKHLSCCIYKYSLLFLLFIRIKHFGHISY